ncbi:MAG: formylglycine-generating enzyme family protein [Chloroflexota bacterium]|nr:formylglycine-generating enzyme family protein [Chloroflexota bacterium]
MQPSAFVVAAIIVTAISSCSASPTPTPGLSSTLVSPADGMTMVFIPAGEFKMGSDIGLTDEQPAHTVYLDAFWIDRTDITNAMYRRCVQAGACTPPSDTTYYNDASYADHPVVFVSWNQATTYCAWVSRRLPTEAEWEKAATWDPLANEKRVYPWGNEFDCKKGNYEGSSCDGYVRTSPVGSFPSGASAYGALDMGGNVWQWVHDAFQEVDPFSGGKTYYAVSPPSNPTGTDPNSTIYRVMRGGSWKNNFGAGRSAYRLWFGLDDSYDEVGFRCARGTSP